MQLALVWPCESPATWETANNPESLPQGTPVLSENAVWQKSMWDNVPLKKEMELIWCCCHRSVMPHPALYPSLPPPSGSLWGVTQWLFNELHVYTVARCQQRAISSYHREGPPPSPTTHTHSTQSHHPIPPSSFPLSPAVCGTSKTAEIAIGSNCNNHFYFIHLTRDSISVSCCWILWSIIKPATSLTSCWLSRQYDFH